MWHFVFVPEQFSAVTCIDWCELTHLSGMNRENVVGARGFDPADRVRRWRPSITQETARLVTYRDRR
jgi:hypothetical protein